MATLNPGLIQSLQVAGQSADAARRQREMMLAQQAQQQEQQRQQQQSSLNPNMIRQFLPQSSGITASPGYTSGGTATSGLNAGGTLGQFAQAGAGGLGGLGGLSVSPAFIGGGTATSGLGAGGSLGAFAQGGAGAGGLGGLGGGAAAGGGGGAMSGLAAAGPWAALAAAVIGNETYAKNHGYRRGGSDYYKDLATGRVLSQDVDNRWAPMLFGKNDRMGLGKDMSFAADLGSFQFGKAFKDLKGSSLFTGFGLFK